MSVYFIQVGRYLKVGQSDNPERRCANLFSGNTYYSAPWDCPRDRASRTLLGYVRGHINEERTAHRALRDFGVGREFFLDEPPSRDYVSRALKAHRVLKARVARPEGEAVWVPEVPPLTPEQELEADLAMERALNLMSRRTA